MLNKEDVRKEIQTLEYLNDQGSLTKEDQMTLWMLKNIYRLVKDLPEPEIEKRPDPKKKINYSYFALDDANIRNIVNTAGPARTNPFTTRTPATAAFHTNIITTLEPVRGRIIEIWRADEYTEAVNNNREIVMRNPVIEGSFEEEDENGNLVTFYEVWVDAE